VSRRVPNVVLTTEQDPNNPNPDKIPAAYRAAAWIQEKIGVNPSLTITALAERAMTSIPPNGTAASTNPAVTRAAP
jgi:hypothetical protein